MLNDVLMHGRMHTKGMEGEQSSVSAQGESKKELKNYRPVAIINVVCKLFMMVLGEREKIDRWNRVAC